MPRRLPLACCLLLALAAPLRADERAPRRLPVPADLRERGTETWYGIYMGEAKVGWALRQLGPLTRDGKRFLRSRQVLFMRTQSRGALRTTRIEKRRLYDLAPPHALFAARATTRRGDFTRRIEVARADAGLVAVLHESGQQRRIPVAGPVPTFADETTPAAWIRSAPRVGASLDYRGLDLSALDVGTSTLRVTRVGARGARRIEADLLSASGDRDRVVYDATGVMVETRMMGIFTIRRTSREDALRLGEAVDPLAAGEASVDKRLGPPELVRNLVLRVRAPGAEQVPSGPGQVAAYDAASATLTLRIGPRLSEPVRVTAAERARHLAATATYPVGHRVVRSLAAETVAGAATPRARAEALVDFVDEFVIDSHTVDPLSALDVLAVQKGDCNEHALLLVTLARAAGIPAREVYGLVYKNDVDRTFGRHVWAELAVDGAWLPVDPLYGEMELSASHVRLGAVGEGRDLRFALAGARFELVAIEKDPPPKDGDGGH